MQKDFSLPVHIAKPLPVHIAKTFPFPPSNPVGFEPEIEYIEFDPEKHLSYEKPEYVVDLNFQKIPFDEYISNKDKYGPLAFTSPFKLMNEEGVTALRNLVDRYKEHPCLKQSHARIPLCMRGVGYVSPFVRDMNRSPVIDEIVSVMAREELCAHGMPMNYGHVNVGKIGDDRPVDSWHVDSVDYVIVVIISDMKDAVGGELQVALRNEQEAKRLLREKDELKEGDEMMTVAYPGAGYAIFMQGSHILHHVTNVKSASEPRMSFVNSYMRRNVFGVDGTRYSLFAEGDSKLVSGVDFARMKAWRVGNMMDYILTKVQHTEDKESYLQILDHAIAELQETTQLLRGIKNNAPGYYDEKNKMERTQLHPEND
jgi:hypothetical protein